jgi:hypothetical protein
MRVSVCHSTFSQRRTGSACGIGVFFAEENVELTGDHLAIYEHTSDESSLKIRVYFCPHCGTTVLAKLERFLGGRVIFGGTFDDSSWFKRERHIWTRSAQSWMSFSVDVPRFEKSVIA